MVTRPRTYSELAQASGSKVSVSRAGLRSILRLILLHAAGQRDVIPSASEGSAWERLTGTLLNSRFLAGARNDIVVVREHGQIDCTGVEARAGNARRVRPARDRAPGRLPRSKYHCLEWEFPRV